ncbi:MAG: uroporphyrinogen decarboxylase [Magnetospiraceae bacterium]
MNPAPSKRFLRVLNGERLDPPPVWLMRQAGRYLPEYREIRQTAENFLEFCYTPDKATEVTLQPLRRYGFDAAILFSDILVIPDALGQSVAFKQGEGPVLDPIRDRAGVEALTLDRLHDHLAPVYETVSRLAEGIPKTTALIGFCGAPWTVATYMVEGRGGSDFSTIRQWDYHRPEDIARLMDLLVEASAAYLCKQVKSGAEVLQIFDTWAGILAEDQFNRLVIDPTRRIIETVKAVHPHVPIIGFPRGAGPRYVDYIQKTGVDAVSLDATIPLEWAAETLQPLCAVQGNLDNLLLIEGGDAMALAARRILEILSKGPHIFNLGHGILPSTSPDHVARLMEIIRNPA